MTYTTQGIVLNYQKYRDFDRIYTIYTRDFGKLHLLARGSNRIKSKLAGHLEPAVLSNLMLAVGKGFDILAQAVTLQSFKSLRQNVFKFKFALILLEGLDKLTQVQVEERLVFDLVSNMLRQIEQFSFNETTNEVLNKFFVFSQNLVYYYWLHLLILLGYAPDLRHQRQLAPLLRLTIVESGQNVVLQDVVAVSEEAKRLIRQYLTSALNSFSVLEVEKFLIL